MNLLTAAGSVLLTTSEQDYVNALYETISQSFVESMPLLIDATSPSLSHLQSLNLSVTSYQNTSRQITNEGLWEMYATLFHARNIPPVYDVHRLVLWYKAQSISLKHVVLILHNSKLFAPTLCYAAFHQYPLLHISDTAAARVAIELLQPDYVTIAANAESLTFHTLQNIYRFMGQQKRNHTFFQQRALGFLTGRDQQAITWTVLKATMLSHILPAGQEVITWLPYRDNALLSKITSKRELPVRNKVFGPSASFSEVTTRLLKKSAENMPDLLVLESHGGEHFIRFEDGALCGATVQARSGQNSHADGSFTTPVCGYNRSCFRKDVVPMSELTVKHILASTCNSLKPGNTVYADQYNIGLNALDSAALTYVGTSMMDETKHSDIFFYTAALKSGMTVGDAVRLLNNVTRGYFPSANAFILVGNPQANVLSPTENTYQTQIHPGKDQQWEIKVDVIETSLIIVHLPIDATREKQSLCCKSYAIHALPDPLYFSFIEHPDALVLYLYTSGEPIPTGHYHFTVGPLPSVIEEVQIRTHRLLITHQTMLATQLLPENYLQDQLVKIKALLSCLIDELSFFFIQGKLSLQGIETLEDIARRLLEHIYRIDQDLLVLLLRHNGAGLRSYMLKVEHGFYPQLKIQSTIPCLCGNDMVIQRMNHVALDYSLTGHFCPLCGLIYHSLNKEFYLAFKSLSYAIDGQDWIVEVMFYNQTNQMIEGYASLLVFWNSEQLQRKARHKADAEYEPQQVHLSLPPGASYEQCFTVRTHGFTSAINDLSVCFVSDMMISVLQHEVFLTSLPDDVIQSYPTQHASLQPDMD